MPMIMHDLQSTSADWQQTPNSCWWACMCLLWNRYWGSLHGGWWRYPWILNPAFEPIDDRERRIPSPERQAEVDAVLRQGGQLDPRYWFLYGIYPDGMHVSRLCRLFNGVDGGRWSVMGHLQPTAPFLYGLLTTKGPIVVVSRTRASPGSHQVYCHAVIVYGIDYDEARPSDGSIDVWNPDRYATIANGLTSGENSVPFTVFQTWHSVARSEPMQFYWPEIPDAAQHFAVADADPPL